MDDDLRRRFAIKVSRVRGRARCAICDKLTITLNGPDVHIADTNELVCWDCGIELAPHLMGMLGLWWTGRVEMMVRVTRSA